jgi:hypothetical protein
MLPQPKAAKQHKQAHLEQAGAYSLVVADSSNPFPAEEVSAVGPLYLTKSLL